MNTDSNAADTNSTRQRGMEPNPSLTRRVSMYPLGEIAEITMGQSPPGSTYNRDGRGVPLLNGPAEFGERHPIPVQWTTEPSRFARKGDILFCVRGATTGRKCWSDQSYAIGRGLAAMRGRSGTCDTQYLWFLLDVVIDSLLKRAAGSTFVNLPGEEILKFRVFLPPLAEQERIAARLTEQLAAVASARAAAQARLAAAAALPAAYLREVFEGPEASEWPQKPLGELATLVRGKFTPRPRNDPRFYGGKYPWIQIGEIGATGKYITTYRNTLNEDGLVVSKMFPKGTLVISIAATIGAAGILTFDSCMPDSLVAVIPKQDSDTEYLYYVMTLVRRHLEFIAPQMAQANIKLAMLEPLLVPSPPLETQHRIAAALALRLTEAERLAAILRDELAAIDALPAALLREAFNGYTDLQGT